MGLEEPYALCDKPTRLASDPDDWGDEETIGLFVRRRDVTQAKFGNYGQWAGFHDVGRPEGWMGQRPTILLRDWGSGLLRPVKRPGKPVVDALAATMCLVLAMSREVDTMEERENMRALACRDDLLGLLVFDTVEEMKQQFWLD